MNLQTHISIVNDVKYHNNRNSGMWTAEVVHKRKRYSGRAKHSKIRAAEICLEKIKKEKQNG